MTNLTEDEYAILMQEIDVIQRDRRESRRRRFHQSKLDPFRGQIIALDEKGSSLNDIVIWLETKRLTVSRSTISRALHRWSAAQAALIATSTARNSEAAPGEALRP